MEEYPSLAVAAEFKPCFDHLMFLVSALCGDKCVGMDHGDVEALIRKDGFEVLRLLFQGYLNRRSEQEERLPSVTGTDGINRTHVRADQQRSLMSFFGEVKIQRLCYSGRGVSSFFPLDEALNLPKDKYSDGLRLLVASEAASSPFNDCVKKVDDLTGGHIGKRQIEELVQKASEDFDAFYAQPHTDNSAAKPAPLLVIQFDGKGIVMRHDDLREPTRKAAEKAQSQRKTRLGPGEKPNRKRMSMVAAVYDIEPHQRDKAVILRRAERQEAQPPRPQNKRVWASVKHEAERVVEDAFDEALRRDPEKKCRWLVLVDGQESQLDHVYAAIDSRELYGVVVIQDLIHVIEYLWKAAYAFHAVGSPEAEVWVNRHLENILDSKAGQTAASMLRSAKRAGLDQNALKAVDKCAAYLKNSEERLDYADALKNGWPIATGVIEGACRHLIKDRMEVTGARWSLAGAESVLRLRSLKSSGDLDEYFIYHKKRERERNYACNALAA